MVNKKLINGLKYDKLSESQLYDLSSWELVDIILAYREDLKAKEQECETLASKLDFEVQKKECLEQECEFSNLRIIQLQETLSQYETDLSTKDCIVETCKAQYKELKAENENWQKEYWKLEQGNDFLAEKNSRLRGCLAEIKEIAEPYQKDIDKICGNCRRYDGCHACCMDTLNNYEYRTGTTKACDKFIELKDFDINKLANQILQKISEVEDEHNG